MKDITHYFSSPDKSPDDHVNCIITNTTEEPKNELRGNTKGVKRKKQSNRSTNLSSRKKQKSEHQQELFKKSVFLDIEEPNNTPLEVSQVIPEAATTFNDRTKEKSNASDDIPIDETNDDSSVRLIIEDSDDSDESSKIDNGKYHKVKRKRIKKSGSSVKLVSSKATKPRLKREKKTEKQNESFSVSTNDTSNLRKLNLCKLNITVSKQIRASKDVSVENTGMLVPESVNINSTACESEITESGHASSCNYNDLIDNVSDDCKSKNNLLSYFNKVPKVDVFRKSEKFEVRAVVHTPPVLHSNRLSNRETNAKLSIKRKKKSTGNITDADKIEFVRTEILDSDNGNGKNTDKIITKEELSASKSWKMRIRLRDASQESGEEDVESENTIPYAYLPENADKKENSVLLSKKSTHSVSNKAKCRLAMLSPKQKSACEDALKYNGVSDNNHLVKQKVANITLKKAKSRLAMCSSQQNSDRGNSSEPEEKPINSPLVQLKSGNRLDPNLPKQDVVNTSVKKVTRSSMKLNLPMETVNTETVKHSFKENKSATEKKVPNANKPACVKLAPVFTQNSKKKNKNVDQQSVCARNNFLQSGVPEAVKRMVDTQRKAQDHEERTSVFPIISHIQQKNIESVAWNLPYVDDFKFVDTYPLNISPGNWELGSIINLSNMNIAKSCKPIRPPLLQTFRKVLLEMKSDFPNFPIYRTFKKLYERNCEFKKMSTITDLNAVNHEKKKLRNNNSESEQLHSCTNCESNLIWTEKYKPLCCDEVLGSNTSKRKLKKWLESWKLWSNGSNKSIKKKKKAKSSSDDESESESCCSSDTPATTVLLTGTYGSGKTSAVYAIANELGFKVIEINASSKRTGKRILSKIQEATQSHQVQSSEPSVSDIKKYLQQPKKKSKKKAAQHTKAGQQKKNVQQAKEEVNSKMSLILVEDADIVFEEQDEGFIGALSSLSAASKRPVILVANNGDCPYLAKFKDQHMHIKFDEFCPDELSIWLQLVCLVEGLKVDNSAIKTLLEYCKNDVRKCLLQLQVWILSGGDNLLEYDLNSVKQHESKPVLEQVDECSNMSWSFEDSANSDSSLSLPVHKNCMKILTNINCNSWEQNFPSLLDLDGIWWNLGPLLNLPQVDLKFIEGSHKSFIKKQKNRTSDDFLFYDSYDEIGDHNEEFHLNKSGKEQAIGTSSAIKPNITVTADSISDVKNTKSHDSIPIEVMAELMDTLSCVDLLSANIDKHSHTFRSRSLDLCPWQKNLDETNSLEQCMTQPQNLTTSSITQWLVENSILHCRSHLRDSDLPKYDHTQPREECRKWISEQHLLSTAVWDIVPVSRWLNRTAMAADYGSFFRRISRLEKIRFEKELKSSRRRNRFFHYLKDLGTVASVETCHSMGLLFKTECD